MNHNFRLFFAISLTPGIRNSLDEVQKQLQKSAWDNKVKWSKPDNLHITLRFIGNSKAENVIALQEKAEKIAENTKNFKLELGGLKLFPNSEHSRVLAVDVLRSNELLNLAKKLETIVCNCGFTPEPRPYNPHLTLGRTKSNLKLNPVELPTIKTHSMIVDSFVLFDSTHQDHNKIYQKLKIFNFT